jgi:hypothetical protein
VIINRGKDYRVIKLLASQTPALKYIVIGEPYSKSIIKELPTNLLWTGTISDQKLIRRKLII